MTDTCGVCERPVKDQARLCASCTDDLELALVRVPELMDDLTIMLVKRAKVASTGPSPTDSTQLDFNLAASNTKDRLRKALGSCVAFIGSSIEAPMGNVQTTCTYMSGWLIPYLPWLRHQDTADDHYSDIVGAITSASRAVDLRPSQVYVGVCGYHDAEKDVICTAELWARKQDKFIVCRVCDRQWNVQQRRDDALSTVEDRIEYPETIARALSAHGVEITGERIYNWRKRGQLLPARIDPVTGRARYRIGDVLDTWHGMEKRRRK